MEKLLACTIILFALILIYIILCKLYISMLMVTGLSKSAARFQVFSLFTMCGYSTGESELLMYHKTRRKIALAATITGFIFSIMVTSLVIGVVSSLNFNGELDKFYMRNLLVTLGITILIFIGVILLTRIPLLRKKFYEILKNLMKMKKTKSGNPITIEEFHYDKYIAQIELVHIPEVMKDKKLGDIHFSTLGITVLLVVSEEDGIATSEVSDIVLKEGYRIEVYGDIDKIMSVFSMK